ncbi:MAG TPA: TIGR01777 family oxidoreductase [Bryobacteraceae bacterium]|nr:TIGR01777 family oxidoreductase [Bryobacteraceae bacterium]
MKCIVSGGTGFLGKHIVERLRKRNHDVIVWGRKPDLDAPIDCDAVVQLAGEPVAQRWNDEIKRRIRDSRVEGTRNLVQAISAAAQKPKVLVSASAIGIYGSRGDEILTESSTLGTGFLAEVCKSWEAEADRAAGAGVRVVKLRIGFVLGNDGGALAQMVPVFRAFAGGRLGSGKQWMPWIHIDDVAELFTRAVEDPNLSGVWNATSPNPARNADFTQALAHVLHRPALFAVPRFTLNLAFGELAQHMIDSARVVPAAALDAGFVFRYPELTPALGNLLA